MGTQLFDQLIGDVPPSSVDVAGIVRREKRRSVARRITGVATAVVALSVSTAIGLSMTTGTGTSSPPVAGGSAGVVTPDTRFALVAYSAESAAASAKRLGVALDEAFQKEASGATWIFEPELPGQTGPDGRPPKLSYHVQGDASGKKSEELFSGTGGVLNSGRKGSLHLGVNATDGKGEDGAPQRDAGTCPAKGADCQTGKTPSGARTVLLRKTFETGARVDTAEVALPDGRALRISHTNTFGVGGAGPAQRAMPLTDAQLMAIAVEVASHIKA